MKLERNLVFVSTLAALVGSITTTIFFIAATLPYHHEYVPFDFYEMMVKIHAIVSAGFAGCLIGFFFRSFWGKFLSLISSFLILAVYLWWYFEKFRWMDVTGLISGSAEYAKRLEQIGFFREANIFDIFLFFFAVALVIWFIFRFRKPSGSGHRY